MSQISFQYPTWYVLFCLAAGLLYAVSLYGGDRRFREMAPRLPYLLAALRLLSVSLIALLLLEPLLRSVVTEVKKPIVVVAQDVSESVGNALGADTTKLQTALQGLAAQLTKTHEVATFSFGERVRPGLEASFADKATNLDELFRQLYDRFAGQLIGAIILATDGVYNRGANPLYASQRLNAPLYVVALGDTVPDKDLLLKQVFFNKIVYLGDRFAVQADVAATNCKGSRTQLRVQEVVDGQLRSLQQLPIDIERDDFFTTIEVTLEANQPGVRRYRFSLSPVPDEVSSLNNSRDIFVEVLDARQKILLLAHGAHPDIGAIRRILDAQKNYELTVAYAEDQTVDVASYDFVILHQLPSQRFPIEGILKQLDRHRIPRWFIVGAHTDLARLNQVQDLLTIRAGSDQLNDVVGWVQPQFSLFKWDERLATELKVWPPVQAPFGDYQQGPATEVWLWQRIGKVDTQYPLWLFGESQGVRIGLLAAEGLWRWRLFEYLQHERHELVDELIYKTVQYLSVKDDKRRFRVSLPKNIFDERAHIVFDAELYNPAYELVNEPDVTLVIRDIQGREYTFVMDKTDRAYRLDAGALPVGEYTYWARVTYAGTPFEAQGRFSVQPIQLEAYATTADHVLLRKLAERQGGALLYLDQVDQVAQLLEDSPQAKPVVYASTRTRPLVHLKWLFSLILGLLAMEWFLRRYFGSY